MVVFGIGLPKTGTRSLAMATRMLGLRTLHRGDAETTALVDRAHEEGLPLLTHLGRFDVYFDVAGLVRRFALLDEQYPDARFILTTRDLPGWLESSNRHELGKGRSPIEPESRARQWDDHHVAVRSHFSGRDDLLEFDVTAGHGWAELAPFLGRRPPRAPFPWENQRGTGTYEAEPRFAKHSRRLRYGIARVRYLGR